MRYIEDLPSPQGLPVLGNLHQIQIKSLHRIVEQWEAELGPVFAFDLGSRRVLVTSDPALSQQALRDRPKAFRKLSSMTSVIDEMGFNGVFSAEGERWRPQRTLVMEALAKKGLPAFFPTLQEITQRLYRRWSRVATDSGVTDVVQDLTQFTVDVTSTLSFGQDINTLESEGNLIQRHLMEIFPMVTRRANFPVAYWHYIQLPRDRRLNKSIAVVREFVLKMIDKARHDLERNPAGEPSNLLQAMILLADESDSGIHDDIVYANVVTLLLAGEDTTAHTLAWAMYCLARHPSWQDRLHEAARRVLGDSPVATDYKSTEDLALFEAVAFEAMRFKPTVPLVFLETNEAVTLGDVRLDAGTPVFLSLRAAMNDAEHFGNPEHFDPERWLADRGSGPTHNRRAFMQFGAGPRVCPGRHLAILEIRMALSMLFRNFSIEFAGSPADVDETFSFTMLPSSLPLRFIHRSSS